MKFRPVFYFILLISSASGACLAGTIPVKSLPVNWSIIPTFRGYDSLNVKFKKKVPSSGINAVKEYLNIMQFRELLKASDKPPLIFPTSAGFFNGSLPSDSLSAFNQLIFLSRNLGDRNAEAAVLHSYGIINALNGNMDYALILFNEALIMNIELSNTSAIVKSYLNLARVNSFNGNFPEAIRYSQALVDISTTIRSNSSLAEGYMSLANLWTTQKNFQEAESMVLKKALPLYYYKLKDKPGTMKCYDQLALIYQQQKRFSEAKWFNIQSNMLARKINNPSGIVTSLINLAHVKMSIGDHLLALRDLREAEQLSLKHKLNYKLIEIKNDLAELYNKMGDPVASNSAFSEFSVLKDALLSKEN
jgi:tetratricopeptide (TPR) repeat protein